MGETPEETNKRLDEYGVPSAKELEDGLSKAIAARKAKGKTGLPGVSEEEEKKIRKEIEGLLPDDEEDWDDLP